MGVPFSSLFSPFGSGGLLRRRTEAANQAVREIDALATENPSQKVNSKKLGAEYLVVVEDEGKILRVVSLAREGDGPAFIWKGVCSPLAPVFSEFHFGSIPDRERFIDFVFNFRHVVYNRRTGRIRIVDADEAEKIMSTGAAARQHSRLMQVALG